ncbi:UDP-N-acetylglucosamine 2-epimerase (hydrolyzing), partial [Vibrio parahaemolyticus]|nr:UDP-N-acetylglucosamine 2-epimerase (hydrolyzing) [Vibrio parahaemolyticus]
QSIKNVIEKKEDILKAIQELPNIKCEPVKEFGDGSSDENFIRAINDSKIWQTNKQKRFMDLKKNYDV